mgnify:CR=1 FL=1
MAPQKEKCQKHKEKKAKMHFSPSDFGLSVIFGPQGLSFNFFFFLSSKTN